MITVSFRSLKKRPASSVDAEGGITVWNGVSGYTLSPLLPLDGNGDIMPWHTCPYNFYLEVWARITDGVQYLVWGTDSIYQSIIAP